MDEKASRVRWDDEELARLAAFMAPRLLADPRLPLLEAARAAQEGLPPHRRRDIKAWSMVEARLQPRLLEALARLRAQPQGEASAGTPATEVQPAPEAGQGPWLLPLADVPAVELPPAGELAAVEAEPAPESAVMAGETAAPAEAEAMVEVPPAEAAVAAETPTAALAEVQPQPAVPLPAPGQVADLFAAQAEPVEAQAPAALPRPAAAPAATPALALDPLHIETALVAALQSPVVEAALVDLFTRALGKAMANVQMVHVPSALMAPVHRPPAGRRVLLAGFPEPQQRSLMDALGERFEVRAWKPAHGPQLFETLAKLCGVVVFPEDADDEVDAGLKSLDVRVIRHAGNASRLLERIEEMA